MKTVLFKGLLFALLFIFQTGFVKAQCLNGNLENGNLTGWNTWTGGYLTPNQNMTPGVSQFSTATGPTVALCNTGDDDNVLTAVQKVYEGGFSIRVGDLGAGNAGQRSSMASYTFTVTQTNRKFSFWYALVMNNAGHSPDQQPGLAWFMKLGPGTTANSVVPTSANDPSYEIYQLTKFERVLPQDPTTDSYFTNLTHTAWWYRNWSCQTYNLEPWVGQQVTIYFRTKDCSPGPHAGYAYIDGLCEGIPTQTIYNLPTSVCLIPASPIILNASASYNEDSYTIGIVQNFPAGTSIQTILGTAYQKSFIGQAGILDLRNLYVDANGNSRFLCGKTYTVTLTTTNSCGGSHSLTRTIQILCPPANAGADKSVCCGNSVTIGANQAVYTWPYPSFSWSPLPPGVQNGNSAQISFVPTKSGTYTLTTTASNGCQNIDQVNVILKNDFNVSVIENCPQDYTDYNERNLACNLTLSAQVTELACNNVNDPNFNINEYTFTWEINGQLFYGQTITKPPYDPNYGSGVKLTASNGCYSKTIYFNQTCKSIWGEFPPIIMPNSVRPASSIYEASILRISQFGNVVNWAQGSIAYNAWGYRLMVWHGWGTNLVYDSDIVVDFSGLQQGEIIWDPVNNLQTGDYVYTLDLFNCSYPEGKRIKWAVGKYCDDEGSNGQLHTAAWPPNCWFYPVCCTNLVNSSTPTFNSAGIYQVFVTY